MDLAAAIISRLGIDPEKLKAGLMSAIQDAQTVRNEVLAAKAGFINAAGAFNERLANIEAQNRRILELLEKQPPRPKTLNGAKDHDRPQDAPEGGSPRKG